MRFICRSYLHNLRQGVAAGFHRGLVSTLSRKRKQTSDQGKKKKNNQKNRPLKRQFLTSKAGKVLKKGESRPKKTQVRSNRTCWVGKKKKKENKHAKIKQMPGQGSYRISCHIFQKTSSLYTPFPVQCLRMIEQPLHPTLKKSSRCKTIANKPPKNIIKNRTKKRYTKGKCMIYQGMHVVEKPSLAPF